MSESILNEYVPMTNIEELFYKPYEGDGTSEKCSLYVHHRSGFGRKKSGVLQRRQE